MPSRFFRRTEAAIERSFVKKCPYLTMKMGGPNDRGKPDRIVLIPGGKPLFIEFKRPGEKPTPLQEYVHAELRKLGYDVETHTDAHQALRSVASTVLCTCRKSSNPVDPASVPEACGAIPYLEPGSGVVDAAGAWKKLRSAGRVQASAKGKRR